MCLLKIITLLLISTLIVFTACSSPATSPPSQPTQPTTPPQTETPSSPRSESEPGTALTLEIVSITSPVSAGTTATLVAKTIPGADCDIEVYYKSGASKDYGLFHRTAGSDGVVSWFWRVAPETTPGDGKITVSASSGGNTVTKSVDFTVE